MNPSTSFADVYNTQTAAIDRLEAENQRLRSVLWEIANTPATPANHDLVAVIMLAQLALRGGAPTAPPAR